jgi:cytochrome c oxidase subunit III
MSVVLVFIVVVMGLAGWWLSHQRIFSKPWLEHGADAGAPRSELPPEKVALVVFLAVVGAVFALFSSAYFMRMALADWRAMPLPRLVWVNTAVLALSSVALQGALVAAGKRELETVRLGLATGGVAAIAFLVGQLLAWRQLVDSGFLLAGNPANSFFYLLTAAHGLHIIGGLVALGRTTASAWTDVDYRRLRLRVELCTMYAHFLLFVWFAMLVLFTGLANDFVALCVQALT